MPRICFFIQVRLKSSRLPGKVLMPVADDLPLIDAVHHRLRQSKFYSPGNTCFLTTKNPADDDLVTHFKKHNWQFLRGDEDNVFSRFVEACRRFRPDYFFRICADNPFLEVRFIDELIRTTENGEYDYLSFATPNGTPVIKTHYGFFAELIRADAFQQIEQSELNQATREHVTPIFYEHPDQFNIRLLQMPAALVDERIRLTVDTPEDLEIVREILAKVDLNADIEAIYETLKTAPYLLERMQKQKELHKK